MNCDIDAALLHRPCALPGDGCKKNATNDCFMKPSVSFHWSHVVMDKLSPLSEYSGRHLVDCPRYTPHLGPAPETTVCHFVREMPSCQPMLHRPLRVFDRRILFIGLKIYWTGSLQSFRKSPHPSKTHPRNDPAKKHFLARNACLPACLSMPPEKTFLSTKRRLSR